jgi:hypothetical protein
MGEIVMGGVVRLIDGPLAPIRCVSQTAYARCSCPDEDHCGLRILMEDVRSAVAGVLDRHTLADVVGITLRKIRRDGATPPFAARSVLIATDAGVHSVPPIYVRAARTMGSRGLHTWIRVIIPAALPFIVSGMKQGWAFAWRSLMAAEIYVTILTGFGLGHLLHYGRELSAMDQVIGIILVIIGIGLLADKLLFSPMERFLHRRWGTRAAR